LHVYRRYSEQQMKKNGVGLQFSADNYTEKGTHSFCRDSQGTTPFEIATGMWARNIKRILKKENDVMDWIYLAQDWDKW